MASLIMCILFGIIVYPIQGANLCPKVNFTTNIPVKDLQEIVIECKMRYILADIEIVGVSTVVDGYSYKFIYGKTPSMMHYIQQCYWKRQCVLPRPSDLMIFFVTLEQLADDVIVKAAMSPVLMAEVQFLRAVRAKCIRSKLVSNVYTKTKGGVVRAKKFNKRKGIFKSHDLYPWFYNSYKNVSHICTFLLKKRYFVVEIKYIDICEGDIFVIRSDKKNITDIEDDTILVFTKKADKYVEIEFTIAEDSEGCGGFLICYRYIDTKKDGRKTKQPISVCETLYRKKKKTPTICAKP